MRFKIISWMMVVVISLVCKHYVYAGEIDSTSYTTLAPNFATSGANVSSSSLFNSSSNKMVPTSYNCSSIAACKPYVLDVNLKGLADNTALTRTDSYDVKGYYLNNSSCSAQVQTPGTWNNHTAVTIAGLDKLCYTDVTSNSLAGNYSQPSVNQDKYAIGVEYKNADKSVTIVVYLDLATYAGLTNNFANTYSNTRTFNTTDDVCGANQNYVNAYYLANSGCNATTSTTTTTTRTDVFTLTPSTTNVVLPILHSYNIISMELCLNSSSGICLRSGNLNYSNFSRAINGKSKYAVTVKYKLDSTSLTNFNKVAGLFSIRATDPCTNHFEDGILYMQFDLASYYQTYAVGLPNIPATYSSTNTNGSTTITALNFIPCVPTAASCDGDMGKCHTAYNTPLSTTTTTQTKSCLIKQPLPNYYAPLAKYSTATCSPTDTTTYYYCGDSTNDQCYINGAQQTSMTNCQNLNGNFSVSSVTCYIKGVAQLDMTPCSTAYKNPPSVTTAATSCYISTSTSLPNYYQSPPQIGVSTGVCSNDATTNYYYCKDNNHPDLCFINGIQQASMQNCLDAYNNRIASGTPDAKSLTVNLLGSGSSNTVFSYKSYTPQVS